MTGLEALQSVQYVTLGERRFALVSLDDWETLIEWLETIEDAHIAKQAIAELEACGGQRQRAGWLRWDEVKEELK